MIFCKSRKWIADPSIARLLGLSYWKYWKASNCYVILWRICFRIKFQRRRPFYRLCFVLLHQDSIIHVFTFVDNLEDIFSDLKYENILQHSLLYFWSYTVLHNCKYLVINEYLHYSKTSHFTDTHTKYNARQEGNWMRINGVVVETFIIRANMRFEL